MAAVSIGGEALAPHEVFDEPDAVALIEDLRNDPRTRALSRPRAESVRWLWNVESQSRSARSPDERNRATAIRPLFVGEAHRHDA